MHDTMAFTAEGTPLGIVDAQCWARVPQAFGQKHRRYERPIEEKESRKWLGSYRRASEAQKRCSKTMVVSVGDREADIYELFVLALGEAGGAKLLVRAERDRLLADGQGHLWEMVGGRPLAGIQGVHVPRRGKRAGREARLEVRFARVRLRPPKRKSTLAEVEVWAVLAEEVGAPAGEEPLKWMLWTTVEGNSYQQAVENRGGYAKRWGLEGDQRTLKSGRNGE